MALDSYLTYNDYKKYCITDPVPVDEFEKLRDRAKVKIDNLTFGRLSKFETYDDLPKEVKMTVAQFIDFLVAYPVASVSGVLTGYSNGIETFNYAVDTLNPQKALNGIMWSTLKENLFAYPWLWNRGMKCG